MASGPDTDEVPSAATAAETLDSEVCTATALGDAVADLVEDAQISFDYVVGDATDVSTASSGHCYFDLVHDDSTLNCVAFQYQRAQFADEIEEDTRVAVAGDLSYYAPHGTVNVVVSDVVVLGDGEYDAIYEQNRSALADDGLLADDAKQSPPEYPETVGLVTSADSDAREDAVTSIHERHPGVDVIVQDAVMQGDGALPSILPAVSELETEPTVDVIVVTRGGGADKDLRVFDELALCRVFARTDTPIVVAVGHEQDRALAGEVADGRAMTPTDIGQTVLEDSRQQLLETHARLEEDLAAVYGRRVTARLDELTTTLDAAYTDRVEERTAALRSDLDQTFERRASEDVTDLRNRLDHAVDSFERERRHEAEKESAVEEAAAEVHAEHARTTRRQRVVIAGLLVLLLALLVLVVLLATGGI